MKEMNLPNKLTMLRIILVPFFILFMALPVKYSVFKFIALFIYIAASITDFLDGHIARSRNLITNFGKIADPLADKLLVSSGFVMLTYLQVIPGFITAIILFRDLTVSSLRMFAVNKGGDVAAIWSGKVKTVFELIGICLGIFMVGIKCSNVKFFGFIKMDMNTFDFWMNMSVSVIIFMATVTTIWSLVDYFLAFKKYIDVTK